MSRSTPSTGLRRLIPVIVARYVARAAGWASRRHGGGGTSLPGKLLLRLRPDAIGRMMTGLRAGRPSMPHVVLVSATNGKTTTAAMLASALRAGGVSPVAHNVSGANLASGIATTLLTAPRDTALLLLECDEAALARMVRELGPDVLVLGNLFRDQLDRYGELDSVESSWRSMAAALDPSTRVVATADDPRIAAVLDASSAPVTWIGCGDGVPHASSLPDHADARWCPWCDTELIVERVYVGHLGQWRCPGCERERPALDVTIAAATPDGLAAQSIELVGARTSATTRLAVPGTYNAYNAALAAAAATEVGVPAATAAAGLARFRAAFGRFEEVVLPDGRRLVLVLAKNPTGLSEVARTLGTAATAPDTILIALNDGIADGRDVSWIWDADIEPLAPAASRIIATGTRPEELALRLAHGVVPRASVTVTDDLTTALDDLVASATSPVAIVTYTALLDLRATLRDRGWVQPFWEPAASAAAAGAEAKP